MSPASRAPQIKKGPSSQGSQTLALGLAKAAASQLDDFFAALALGKSGFVMFRRQVLASPFQGAAHPDKFIQKIFDSFLVCGIQ